MARREAREYREYLSDEQRSQPGCPARELGDGTRFQGTSPGQRQFMRTNLVRMVGAAACTAVMGGAFLLAQDNAATGVTFQDLVQGYKNPGRLFSSTALPAEAPCSAWFSGSRVSVLTAWFVT